MTFGHSISGAILPSAKIVTNAPKPYKRFSKGSPLDTIFGRFGAPSGNVKICVSPSGNHDFQGWRGSRESSCAAPCAECFPTCFSERLFLDLLSICGPKGVPGEVPRRTHEQLFRLLFPTCLLWGAPGKPKVSKTLPRPSKYTRSDSKMIPRGCKNNPPNSRE